MEDFITAEEDDAEYEFPTRQDLRAAKILLQLPKLFLLERESRNRRSLSLNLRWAAKRRRKNRSRRPIGALAAAPEEPKPWADAASPDTPLVVSYSGGSSDPKSGTAAATATAKRKSIKRTTEELRLAESMAQKERQFLRGEVEILRKKSEWQKSLNMELKRTQKLLILSQGNEKAQWEKKKVSTSLTLGLLSAPSADVLYPSFGILGPLDSDPTALREDKSSNIDAGARALPSLQPGVALLNLSLGPPPVPDLNLPVEESFVESRPLDHRVIIDGRFLSRAAAAEARQRRYMINKAKLRR